MQINEIEKHTAGLNRVSITVQLIPDTPQERDAITKTSKGTASDAQKMMLEKQIESYCNNLTNHFVLISAKVNGDGTTELVLEQTGNITV